MKEKPYWKYNPVSLPKALDFHQLTASLPLSRDVKTRIQIALSKMPGKELKRTIEELGDMRYTALNAHNYKMAAYCKSVKEFAESYWKSVRAQNRVGDKY